MRAVRAEVNPIISPIMSETIGSNINGPSLVKVPEWVRNPLGRYYLYFAHHHGESIRLAYSDSLEGPWRIHEPGSLQLAQSGFTHHIASPDVWIDEKQREFRMYFHGMDKATEGMTPMQFTRAAFSTDGIYYERTTGNLGMSYWRTFLHAGYHYALEMPDTLLRFQEGLTSFERRESLLGEPTARHSAVYVERDWLHVYYSRKGDCPERILYRRVKLHPDWEQWDAASEPAVLLEPELEYEGARLPLAPSRSGAVYEPVRQLRDPAVFAEDGQLYLLYSVAGETGLALAKLHRE